MASPRQIITTPPLIEKTTAQVELQLTDQDDAALTSAALTTVTLTLYERISGTILNSRSAQDIKDVNGGSISAGGLLTLILSHLDNALVSQARSQEEHVALIEWTWSSGTRYGKKEITFTVLNQVKVT